MRCAAFLLFSLMLLTGCAYQHKPVETDVVAYVDNHQDAGIINAVRDKDNVVTGYLVRDGYIGIYHWLVTRDGGKLKPPLLSPTGVQQAGSYWIIDAQHAGYFAQMAQLEKPITPAAK